MVYTFYTKLFEKLYLLVIKLRLWRVLAHKRTAQKALIEIHVGVCVASLSNRLHCTKYNGHTMAYAKLTGLTKANNVGTLFTRG